MKHLLLAFMLLASFKSNGQDSSNDRTYFTIPKYSNEWRLVSTESLYLKSIDSTKLPICKQRGHVWKTYENTLSGYSFPYVRDVKDTSYIVTPGTPTYYYCLRCGSDSTYTPETLKIIWTKH